MLTPGSLDPLRLLPDEIVNVAGWDSQRDVGDLEIVVVAPQDVVRGPRLRAGSAVAALRPTEAAPSLLPESQQPSATATGPSLLAMVALAALVGAMAVAAGLAVVAYRAWRRRRA